MSRGLESGARKTVQLWSYNYDPEPTGIAPISGVWARELSRRGYLVEVVAAHPHYPEPLWGRPLRPSVETRDGIRVVRLPLWVGRATSFKRLRQEASYAAVLGAALPAIRSLLHRPDVIVATSPSFPALVPTMAFARATRTPWVLWLQDILPDGAVITGQLKPGRGLDAIQAVERAAYRSAARIVVLSESFRENLRAKRVPDDKIVQIYNPATRPVATESRDPAVVEPARVLAMGNIGHSQGLVDIVKGFEASSDLATLGARLVLAGDGVAADDVRGAIASDRVELTGILSTERLDGELAKATVGLVSQRYEGVEFNVPSKLMNYMGRGLPVVASVRPESEVARILRASGGGWLVNPRDPSQGAQVIADALERPGECAERGAASLAFARENFSLSRVGDRFESLLHGSTLGERSKGLSGLS